MHDDFLKTNVICIFLKRIHLEREYTCRVSETKPTEMCLPLVKTAVAHASYYLEIAITTLTAVRNLVKGRDVVIFLSALEGNTPK